MRLTVFLMLLVIGLPRRDPADEFALRYRTSVSLARTIIHAADRHGIDRKTLFRLVRLESQFDSLATSATGARGLMQLLPSTARMLRPGTVTEELYQTRLNLELGCRYLAQLKERYDGDRWLALVAYSYGMVYADSLRDQYPYAHLIVRDP